MNKILPAEKRLKITRKFTDEQLVELYNLELTDREISEIFNCSFSSVRMRRCKLGLVAHRTGVTGNYVADPEELKRAYKKHISKAGRNIKHYNKQYHHRYHLSKHGHNKNLERKRDWRNKRRELGLPVT